MQSYFKKKHAFSGRSAEVEAGNNMLLQAFIVVRITGAWLKKKIILCQPPKPRQVLFIFSQSIPQQCLTTANLVLGTVNLRFILQEH